VLACVHVVEGAPTESLNSVGVKFWISSTLVSDVDAFHRLLDTSGGSQFGRLWNPTHCYPILIPRGDFDTS
jgi:hypothetical protein